LNIFLKKAYKLVFNNPRQRAEIEFPTEWTYTIIGTDKTLMSAAVALIFSSEKYTLRDSKKSSGGKYLSLEICLWVQSKEQKDQFYQSLANCKDIKMVL
jgi:putative lipoic acid-binding regulatory protein